MTTSDFLDLEDIAPCDYEDSDVVILPAPLERSTSYGKGTARGPEAILVASGQVELYDEELAAEPFRIGITTLPPVADKGQNISLYLEALEQEVLHHLDKGKFVLTLGGEHTLSQAAIAAACKSLGEIGTVQFDAHADLRDRYQGTGHSHACVMRRTLELGVPNLAIGIRALSRREAELIRSQRLLTVWGHELPELTTQRFRELLSDLPNRIYLTFDVDFLDPSLVPATGTPEPGGGGWHQTLALLRTLFSVKEVVAMDVVELAPIACHPSSDFTVARLVYKCIGYLQAGRNQ